MPSINQALYDAANRHQIFLTRFGTGLANRATKLLDEAEADLTTRIASRASKLKVSAVDRTSARYVAIQRAIRAQSRDLTHALNALTKTEFAALAVHEVDLTDRRVSEALGVDLGNFRPPPEVMRALATEGVARQRLSQWWKRLSSERVARLESSVALGIIEGDTTDEIARRFRLAENTTRNSARTLVRTHVNHVANRARQAYYDANADLIKELRWTATLDGRTSDVCKARDGQTFPLDEGPRPPAHPNCRSVMSPILPSFEEFATTPLKAGRGSKDFDTLFQKRLQERGFSAQKAASIRANTRSSMNGQVPDKETYDTWLRKQPAQFITETLGPTKAQLFTRGEITLDRFVEEPTGRSYTLDEIKRLNEQTWMKAFPEPDLNVGSPSLLGGAFKADKFWDRALDRKGVVTGATEDAKFDAVFNREVEKGVKSSFKNVRRAANDVVEREVFPNQKKALSVEHKAGVKWYTNNEGFAETNKKLRAGEALSSRSAAAVDATLQSKSAVDAVVYRGFKNTVTPLNNLKVGETFVDKGVMSTTFKVNETFRFGDDVMAIRVPKGTRGTFVGNMTEVSVNEAELMLPPGTTLSKVGEEVISFDVSVKGAQKATVQRKVPVFEVVVDADGRPL